MTSVLLRSAAPPAEPAGRPGVAPRLAAAVGAGLLLELAFAPVGVRPLAVLAVAGLTLAVRDLPVRWAALAGLLFGLAFFLPLLHWSGAVAGWPAWLALALIEAAYLVPLAAALALVGRLPGWPVTGAGLWVAQEAVRDRLPLGGFAWGRLAFSQDAGPLTGLAALGGAPLVTFAVALLGGLLALLVTRPPRRALLASVGPALALLLVGLLLPTPTAGPTARVALVQGDVPRLGLDAYAQRAAVLRAHVAATHRLAADVRAGRVRAPELVLWPENGSDLDPYTDPAAYALIDGAVRDVGVPTLVGAVINGPGDRVRNVGIVWDPRAGPGQQYVKQHLVPFGEYMPLRSTLRRISSKVDLVPRDFAPGDRPGALQVGPVRVADVICFEVADDGLVRDAVRTGGRLLVVQTNNATFGRSAESAQQLAMARLRAVEHDRSTLVVATSGISAVIRPDGRVAQRSQIFTATTLVADVALRGDVTPATRAGCAARAAARGVGRGRGRRRRGPPGGSMTGLDRVLVVMPTYDERDNLPLTAARLHASCPQVQLLVVDDDSPDGTGRVADELAAHEPWVQVLHRTTKAGLGAAYIAGFGWAREHDVDVVVEMDADGSHAPEQLPRLLAALEHADVVLGSRWVPGGRVVDWPRSRVLLSRGGNAWTRLMLGLPLADATGGFRAYRREVLDALPLDRVASQGYCFQVDLVWRAWRAGARVVEVPIIFVERQRGHSKMSRQIVVEALWRVTWWGLTSQRSHRRPARQAVPR